MTQPNPPTVVSQLTATGTGHARDRDGNLLDNLGNPVVPQPKKDEKK